MIHFTVIRIYGIRNIYTLVLHISCDSGMCMVSNKTYFSKPFEAARKFKINAVN